MTEAGAGTAEGASPLRSLRVLLAGPIAGVCSRFFTYPPDTIKARLQVQGAAGALPPPYRSTLDAVGKVARQEGLYGFYRGFGAVALGSVPANLAYFGGYEGAKALLPDGSGMAGDLLVGVAAQLVGGLAFTPIDIVKERLQVAPLMERAGAYRLSGPLQAFTELVRQNGPLGLLKGYWATNAVWIPWNALYIALYEGSKRAAPGLMQRWAPGLGTGVLPATGGAGSGGTQGEQGSSAAGGSGTTAPGDVRQGVELPPVVLGLCSAVSASVAGLLTHPADVVKTRLQVLSACKEHSGATAWSIAQQMWRKEGARAFMTGVGARMLQLAPGTALSWMIYEPVKSVLAGTTN